MTCFAYNEQDKSRFETLIGTHEGTRLFQGVGYFRWTCVYGCSRSDAGTYIYNTTRATYLRTVGRTVRTFDVLMFKNYRVVQLKQTETRRNVITLRLSTRF